MRFHGARAAYVHVAYYRYVYEMWCTKHSPHLSKINRAVSLLFIVGAFLVTCILINWENAFLPKGSWHSLPEFEVLDGKRGRRWRQSLLHQGRPVGDYNLSCPQSLLVEDDVSAHSLLSAPEQSVGDTSSACSHGASLSSSNTVLSTQSLSTTNHCLLIKSVLCFIKAFHLKGDNHSLKRLVSERFSPNAVLEAKRAIWDFCKDELETADLAFHVRRDSDKRTQLAANLDDIVQAFDVLDSSGLIPNIIYCESNELLTLPPLSLDPTAEQVQLNTQALQTLVAQVENLEKKLSESCQNKIAQSYGSVASAPASELNPTLLYFFTSTS